MHGSLYKAVTIEQKLNNDRTNNNELNGNAWTRCMRTKSVVTAAWTFARIPVVPHYKRDDVSLPHVTSRRSLISK